MCMYSQTMSDCDILQAWRKELQKLKLPVIAETLIKTMTLHELYVWVVFCITCKLHLIKMSFSFDMTNTELSSLMY